MQGKCSLDTFKGEGLCQLESVTPGTSPIVNTILTGFSRLKQTTALPEPPSPSPQPLETRFFGVPSYVFVVLAIAQKVRFGCHRVIEDNGHDNYNHV